MSATQPNDSNALNALDYISRQEAVSAISDLLMLELNGKRLPTWNEVYRAINAVPSAQPKPRWIPVTERLPEVDENVLVSYHLHGESEFFPSHNGVTISYWTGVKNHNIPYFGDLGDASTVLAWMPLPEPYRKETDDED